MQLQTNKNIGMGYKSNIGTLLIGLLIILIPVTIGGLINMPEMMEWIKGSWKEIAKSAVVGFSMLPVILFVTIKGGAVWYKKWWTWGLLIVGVAAIFTLSIIGVGTGAGDAGMEAMNYMGGGKEFY